MKTNREKLLQDAFVMFLQYNYERASYAELTKATGLSKAGMAYYYPSKLELFKAVADRFFFSTQHADVKFDETETLHDFIGRFVENVRSTMQNLVAVLSLVKGYDDLPPQAHFFNFLSQIRRYYPGSKEKLGIVCSSFFNKWKSAVCRAVENGELPKDIDIDMVAMMFNHIYMGRSFEQSLFTGLDVDALASELYALYKIIGGGSF